MAKQKNASSVLPAVSAGTGAVAGATSALAGIAASAAAGTSGAAATTSGLAAVGGIIGGGMAAGLIVVTAAPIAGATAMFGIYKLYEHLASSRS